jgi:glycosyltransferase involved in cell wall biosynthesis
MGQGGTMARAPDGRPEPVAILLKGYPRLSETFIAAEILALQELGLDYTIVAMRRPTDRKRHPVHERITAQVGYLPEYLYQEPLRVLRAWLRVRRRPGYAAARRQFLADLVRDRTANRGRRFGQALVLAAELPERFRHIYAHFLHTPASVARYAALVTGRGWSVSAHAKDIWTTPDWEKREKLADAAWAVTCTAYGQAELERLAPGRVDLAYHGLHLDRLPSPPEARPPRDGADPGDPLRLVSVGRAVVKKGFDVLLDALARLPGDLNWRWVHVGGGDELKRLKAQAARLGLEDRIEWRGSQAHDGVMAACREADLFVLPSRIAADGDRDGLPNVLMEAASQDLCCLATRVAAIPELIAHGETGWLVEADDADGLAAAIARLGRAPAERLAIGRNAGADLRARFGHEAGIRVIAARFGLDAGTVATRDVAARNAAE